PPQSSPVRRARLTSRDEPARRPGLRNFPKVRGQPNAGMRAPEAIPYCLEVGPSAWLASPTEEGAMSAFDVRRIWRCHAHTMLVGLLTLSAGQAWAQRTASDTITRP